MLETFITIIAWLFLVLSILRLYGLSRGVKHPINQQYIKIHRFYGINLVWENVKMPLLALVLSVAWLVAQAIAS